MPPTLPELVANLIHARNAYNAARLQLQAHLDQHFPPAKPVFVKHGRYTGYGVAHRPDSDRLDQLPVWLENGNIWEYPVENCRPATWQEVDRATRRAWLAKCGVGAS